MSGHRPAHAYVLPGHGVTVNPYAPDDDASWLGLIESGEGRLLSAQIEAAFRAAANDPLGVLTVSGGRTRQHTYLSEAQSNLGLAIAQRFVNRDLLACRVVLEEFARDSLENLLFSICAFRGATGNYPQRVYVFGWLFKQFRYRHHARTLHWPMDKFEYHGVNDPVNGLAAALAGEQRKRNAMATDPWLRQSTWRGQREARSHSCFSSDGYDNYRRCAPELEDLFTFLKDCDGTGGTYEGDFPW